MLSSADDKLFEFKLSEDTEYIILPKDMPIGNYQFEISIQAGGLFKRAKEVWQSAIVSSVIKTFYVL